MAVKFFGQYLVEKKIISREKLLEALELQEATNLKFGEMALSMGLITEADVDRVHKAQRTDDMRFGDIAVQIGILTEAQVLQVLTRQKNSYLYIGRALVEVGALEESRLQECLEDFQKDQAAYRVDKIAIPHGVPHAALWEVAADLTYKMLTRVANLSYRPGQCHIAEKIEPSHTVASMEILGAAKAKYLLSVPEGVRQAIARAILEEESVEGEPEEVLDDTVMEFINIVCGNVAAKGAQLGFPIDIAPPEVFHPQEPVEIDSSCKGLVFPIFISSGEKVELILLIEGS